MLSRGSGDGEKKKEEIKQLNECVLCLQYFVNMLGRQYCAP